MFIQMEFSHKLKLDSKEIINFKGKMQKMSQRTDRNDFFYKLKPEYLIEEVSKAVEKLLNGQLKIE